jgi:DNA-binding MarR family transcriptional regulator
MKIADIIKSTAVLSLSKQTLLNVMHTQNVLSDGFSELLKQYNLSSEQLMVLTILVEQKGKPANMCLIQKRMIAKTSNTTRLIDKLLLKELVTREICLQNRRKIEVRITVKGLVLLNTLEPIVNTYEEKFANNLTPNELEYLNFLLEKYRTS